MSFDGNDVEAVRKDRQFGFVGIGNELPLFALSTILHANRFDLTGICFIFAS